MLRLAAKSAALAFVVASAPCARADFWTAHVAPLFREHCTKCHGGAKQKGGLDLRSAEAALAGGESGAALVPGDPAASLLFSAVQPGADPHMPPKGQLADAEIEMLGAWIESLADTQAEGMAQPAAWTLPPGVDPTLAIDTFLARSWAEEGIAAPDPCDDPAFVRRLYLDLLGRIPTPAERGVFLASTSSGKRRELIDELLRSPAHARHLAECYHHILLGRASGRGRNRDERERHFLPYLRWAFASNRPWDAIARDLIVARPESPEAKGAAWFLYDQRDDPGEMAAATASTLFGKQIKCAECHDHPIAPEIGQRHYHALVAFFSRTRNVKTPAGPALGESAAGGYAKFANLEGESFDARLEFLDGRVVVEPGGRRDRAGAEHYLVAPPGDWIDPPEPDPETKKVKLTTDVDAAPVPNFSRRAELARIGIEGNPDFAKAAVNRVWALLLGRGIVHPVDAIDSAHPPSHPELLDWLAADFAAGGYDLRRLCRAILNSRAYQAAADIAPGGRKPRPDTFAVALDRPLAAEVLARSVLVALGAEPDPGGAMPDEARHRGAFSSHYPAALGSWVPPTVQHAMFFTNSPHLDSMLRDGALPRVAELAALESTDEVARHAFLTALGREPDSEERQRAVRYLAERPGRRDDAVRQLLWALFAGAEFHLNH